MLEDDESLPESIAARDMEHLEPSRWVTRFTPLIRPRGSVLDVAAGNGRHCHWFLEAEHSVLALDRDLGQLGWLLHPSLERHEADLEESGGWPLGERSFDAVVVTNYLW